MFSYKMCSYVSLVELSQELQNVQVPIHPSLNLT